MKPFFNRAFLYTTFIIGIVFFGFLIFLDKLSILINGVEARQNRTKHDTYNLEYIKYKDKKRYILDFDLDTNFSITKFVDNKICFSYKKYIPQNLEKISSDFVIDNKGNSQLLRKKANIALKELAKEFYKEFGKKVIVISAYRSYKYQKGIKNRGCPDNLCAKAGYSEHQSGLAVDLFEVSTNNVWKTNSKLMKYYRWLGDNAHRYGFHNTYQKGVKIDGYEIEPWHWRYMGIKLASYLKDNDITFAQYYYDGEK